MKSKRPTLRDVARVADVSYQTVSRVINNNQHVSAETRDRVQKAIRALGFKPNRAAQILQTERSHTIETILFNSGFNLFLYEMARSSQRLGYHFVVSAVSESEFAAALENAAARFIDGLIILADAPLAQDFETMMRLTDGIPFVQIGAKLGASIPSVMYNQAEGARLATQHLIKLGHRQIAEISGPHRNYDGYDRHTGWLATLRDNGLTPGPSVEGNFSVESGYQGMKRLLDSGEPFTAVFIGNDSMSIGAISALRERGLRVPDDISIVGFDDVPEAAHVVPALTTVRQDFQLIGRLAVEYLAGMIESHDAAVYQRVLQPTLIVRDSTRAIEG